jgi:cbb3-type cytochrome oxidase subunit 1
MADVFNQEFVVAVIMAFSAYIILRGIAIFFGKAGKGYLENIESPKKLYLQLIGVYYVVSGVLGLLIPRLEWKTEDIYFAIAYFAIGSVVFWVGLDFFIKRDKKKKQLQQN